jgi:hypothetical protein
MDYGVPGDRSARETSSVTATLNYVAPDSARNRLYVANGGHVTTTRYAPALWRAVSPPPQDTPLALLDYRSVADDEGVPNLLLFVDRLPDPDDVPDIPDPDAHPAGSVFEHRQGHRWWYFPSMVPSEVLLFKLHDTDHSVAWRAPHTAFRDASAPAGNPRMSVELRSIAFFF